jgi:alkylation response protein AidB-like acyl-CoA dehydrogenase
LPKLASGEFIGALALTEPEAGSDAFHLRASARREGDGWVLNGTKVFVTNAPIADLFTVFATEDPAKDMRGLCCFLVEKGLRGVRIGRNLPKAGLRTSPWAEVVLDDCRIPAGNLLGRAGGGAAVFNDAMEWERIGIMAWSLGAMERQLEACVRYCGLRQQSGRPLNRFQAVSHKLADMKVRCEAGRLLLYRAAWLKQCGRNCHAEAAQAKLFVSEAYVKNSLEAVQLHGAFGYAAESGLERELRDALAGTIHSGTSEIQRNIIASALD